MQNRKRSINSTCYDDDEYALSGGTPSGTYRYMAPESMINYGVPIGFPSDVYSFGVVLWELCTLERPFERLSSKPSPPTRKSRVTVQLLVQKVAEEQWRPSLHSILSPHIQSLIDTCWDANPTVRPTFDDICMELSTLG